MLNSYPQELLQQKCQLIVEEVLKQNYVEFGVDELDIAKLSTVINAKYGNTHAAQQKLGDIQDIRRTFIEFQEHLYKEAVA